MKKGIRRLVVGLVLVAIFMGVFPATAHSGDFDSLRIFVSILPQKYFAEQLYPYSDIQVLVGPGQSPHTFEPAPKQLAALSNTEFYFKIGLPFENRMLTKSSDILNHFYIIDTQKGITLRPMEAHHHDHGSEVEHEGTLDPHIWLDPILVKTIAYNMIPVANNSLPHPIVIAALKEFCLRLDSLNAYIAEKLAPYKGEKLYVFHPTFGYFCDRYGLIQVAIETEGKEPSARQLAGLIEQAKNDAVKAIIVQSQFSKKTAEAIASEIGAEVISVDPLAYEYIDNMKSIADTIAKALSK